MKIEREAMMAVLDHLREVYNRRLHLEMGYGSLHEFVVVELRHSDGAAHRRINAMQLCEELPQAKQAIESGEVSLTNAASLEVYFKKEKEMTETQKEKLFREVQGKSKEECERILYPERVGKVIHDLHLDDKTLADLKRLSDLLAIPQNDYATLIKKIAKIALLVKDPMLKNQPKIKKADSLGQQPRHGQTMTSSNQCSSTSFSAKLSRQNQDQPDLSQPKIEDNKKPSRYISTLDRDWVWKRDQGRCTFVDPIAKRRCSSQFGLQYDHIIPIACNGKSTADNLRLRCFAHNLLEAQRVFGREKMQSYAKKSCST